MDIELNACMLESYDNKDEVHLAKAGNKEAFCKLIKKHQQTMYRVALSILKSDDDCADAVQESIIKAYKGIKGLKDSHYYKTWLIKIVINESNRIYKKRSKYALIDTLETNEHAYSDMHKSLEVKQAINSLENDLKTVTVLYYFEDLSVKDISGILNIPEGTVKSRLSKARSNLNKFLKLEE